jgi:hypothetical protein
MRDFQGNVTSCNVQFHTTFSEQDSNPASLLNSSTSSFWTLRDGAEYVRHVEPARLAENAGPELLDALERGVTVAQDVVDFWEHGDVAEAVRALSLWLAEARPAIHKATQQQEVAHA